MWDEWSSPGELIHPGDSASITSITSSEAVLDFATAVRRLRKSIWKRGGRFTPYATPEGIIGANRSEICWSAT